MHRGRVSRQIELRLRVDVKAVINGERHDHDKRHDHQRIRDSHDAALVASNGMKRLRGSPV
jgi:hypothetical protein